jgi:hypothetical protein
MLPSLEQWREGKRKGQKPIQPITFSVRAGDLKPQQTRENRAQNQSP